jgi:orotidine-5'-phosphate decarboxylase
MSFKANMQTAVKSKNSKIILALDLPFEAPQNRQKIMLRAQNILEAVHPYVCAVKINHHLTLPLGLFDGVEKLVEQIRGEGMLAIMDAKVNDIGNTNQVIAEYYYAAGFDAIIANPFVGWNEGLKPLFEVSKKLHRGVILLNYMSHKGAVEGYGQTVLDADTCEHILQYVAFARKAVNWEADGVVVGATVPDKVKEIKQLLKGKVEIYSPGVGAQGGAAETALKAGSDYLIVGREITSSDNPEQAARRLYDSIKGL